MLLGSNVIYESLKSCVADVLYALREINLPYSLTQPSAHKMYSNSVLTSGSQMSNIS